MDPPTRLMPPILVLHPHNLSFTTIVLSAIQRCRYRVGRDGHGVTDFHELAASFTGDVRIPRRRAFAGGTDGYLGRATSGGRVAFGYVASGGSACEIR